MRKQLLQIAKWLWAALVVGAAIYYLVYNFEDFSVQVAIIPKPNLVLALVSLLLGKLLLVELSRESVRFIGWEFEYSQMFKINAIVQLSKYIPGGVWQFVGRAGYYRTKGLSIKGISRAMILENLWLLGSSILFGISNVLLYRSQYMLGSIGASLIWGAGLIILFWIYSIKFSIKKASYLFLLQVTVWTFLGFALWSVIPALDASLIFLVLGAFSLSWGVGFLAFFAPGGIGIREAVFAFILASAIDPNMALVFASVNRFIWIVAELLLGLIASTLRLPNGKN